MSQGSAISSTEVKGLVDDVAPSATTGQSIPLSMTTDGRLRVAVVDARISPPFFNHAQEDMWGGFQTSMNPKSPW